MKRLIFGVIAAIALTGSAYAMDPAQFADSSLGKILVGPKGMTLYVYDKDTKGETASACTGKCIAAWPPLLAPADAMAEGDWTTLNVVDKDGMTKKMWAYKGMPVYYWVKDGKPGDTTGDGVAGVWHVVKEGM